MVNFNKRIEKAVISHGDKAEIFMKELETCNNQDIKIDGELMGSIRVDEFYEAFRAVSSGKNYLCEYYLVIERVIGTKHWKIQQLGCYTDSDIILYYEELKQIVAIAIRNGWNWQKKIPKTKEEYRGENENLKKENKELEKKLDEVVRLLACICD